MTTSEVPAKNLFTEAADAIHELGEILDNAFACERHWEERRPRLIEIRRRLLELNGSWEKKVKCTSPQNIAEILMSMLFDWELPGAIWYAPERRRFRLVGENYQPQSKEEFCLGVYAPTISIKELTEDIAYAMGEKA